ncbi:LexA repressor [Fretibacterium fastidiosum]|uniref:SOS-response transcriptional repressors (RecA-mediated autopeptidases) n=2 Tax=Fretibacterium fastidiosum TaxID=651822 RepID=A0AB94IXE9_9BACT|nr:SOS-response transcriptional repressors (RecA-mediated autopeptidases) [Fretibacterium fastidiosum]
MTEGAEAGIGARIMARRKALGMKRPELAERLGVKPNTLYRYEIGSIGIRDSMKSRIAKELGVSLAYLVSGTAEVGRERGSEETPEPVVPPQVYLPILDQEACAGSGFNWSDVRAGARKWMPWPTLETGGPVGPTKPYFVKVEGDSMIGANIQDGCLILVNPNTEVRSGDIAYVRWNDRCSVKGIIFYNDGRVELRPANKDFSSIWIQRDEVEFLTILGKVVRWLNMGVPNRIF